MIAKVGLAVVLASCGADRNERSTPSPSPGPARSLSTATEIVFQFQDGSKPPEYHRSYRITATPSSIRKIVDSYGKVVSDDAGPLDATGFERIVNAIDRHGLVKRSLPGDHDDCTGGTSHRLEVKQGAQVLLDARVDHCGGTDEGTLAGNVEAFAAEIERLAPGNAAAPTIAK